MKPIQLTSKFNDQVQGSTMEATQGPCKATGVASMAGGRGYLFSFVTPAQPQFKKANLLTIRNFFILI